MYNRLQVPRRLYSELHLIHQRHFDRQLPEAQCSESRKLAPHQAGRSAEGMTIEKIAYTAMAFSDVPASSADLECLQSAGARIVYVLKTCEIVYVKRVWKSGYRLASHMLVTSATISPVKMMLAGLMEMSADSQRFESIREAHYCGIVVAPLQIKGTATLSRWYCGYRLWR